jgi:hypothetical protein
VIALAHIERWLDAPGGDHAGYFRTTPVWTEVRTAAAASIWSDRYPVDAATWANRNAFAFAFNLMDDYRAALAQMDLIGRRITWTPWNYQNREQPAKAYLLARRRVLSLEAGHLAAPPPPMRASRWLGWG